MRKNAILKHAIATALLGSGGLFSTSAWGDSCYTEGGGNWNTTPWDCNHVPTASDTARITLGFIFDLNNPQNPILLGPVSLGGANAQASSVHVTCFGTLNDTGGGSLTVGSNLYVSGDSLLTFTSAPITFTAAATVNAGYSGTFSLQGTAANPIQLSASSTVNFATTVASYTYTLRYVHFASGTWTQSPSVTNFTISNCTYAAGVSVPAAWGCTTLTATPVSATQINLAWGDNSNDETGFKIFRDGVELTPSPKVSANVTTYSDTGLTCNTTYNYEVTATNANGDYGGLTTSATTAACPTYAVTLATAGTGTGTVAGGNNYLEGATVTLSATPNNGSTFTGWSPSPCAASFTMPGDDLTCTATFDAPVAVVHQHVAVQTAGTGTGTVTGSGAYVAGDTVTLTAIANADSTFEGWSPSPCAASFRMPANDLTCTAQFSTVTTSPSTVTPTPVTPIPVTPTPVIPKNYLSLVVQVDGSGRGKVTTDTGMSCQSSDCQENQEGYLVCNPQACTQILNTISTINLTPHADPGSIFSSWGGHPECVGGRVVMAGGRLCIAYFRKQKASLFVTLDGTGQGQVSVDVGKLDWTSNHEAHATYDLGTEVWLTATALPGSYLVGWGGDKDCVDGKVAMKAERACVAHFNLNEETPHTVATEANPTPLPEPTAPVTTTPEVPTTPVVETTPSTVETVPEEVAAQAVVLPPVTLTTVKLGPGNLRSDPAGIDCGETCQAAYPLDTIVTLTAIPTDGASFKEWSGDCNSPELTTTVTVTTDTHCQATFAEAATTTETTTVPEVIPPPAPVTVPEVPVTSPTTPVTTPVTTPAPVETVLSTTPAPVPVATTTAILSSLVSYSCPITGEINHICNYSGKMVTALDVQGQGLVSNGVLNSTLTNVGWVSNFTIMANGRLTGGVVTGYIQNDGVMLDFEFRGASIVGGTLGGTIRNTSKVGGYFQDVTLLAGTKITGGSLKGTIKGDKNSPALLENVRVKKGSQLSGVKLGKGVMLEKGVVVE